MRLLKAASSAVITLFLGVVATVSAVQIKQLFIFRPVVKWKQWTLVDRLEAVTNDRYIAEVLAKSKYPLLLTAIAKQESGFRPLVRGDGGKSWGMFQMQPKLHGNFNLSVENQVRKAEQVMTWMIAAYGWPKAAQKWNGEGRDARRYQKSVLATMRSI